MKRLGRRRPLRLLLFYLGMLVCTTFACNIGTPTLAKDRTRRMAPVVWAGSPATNPPLLNHDNWKDLNKDDAIKTDASGQAELQLVGCTGSLYVFIHTTITVSTCTEPELQSGLATCAQQGTGYFNINCTQRFIVDTYAGRVTVAGTAFSVTYVPDQRLLLVIVFAGRVEVQPVIDFGTGELAPQGIPVNAGQFFYTMPGPEWPELHGLPAQTPLPLEELPLLVDELRIQPWMDSVGRRAKLEGVLPGNWPAFGAPGRPDVVTVVLHSAGGPLGNSRVQKAVLTAIDKDGVAGFAFRGQEVAFLATVSGVEVDARVVPYDTNSSKALLAEVGYPYGLDAHLVFPIEDKELLAMARAMAEDLAKAGIDVELLPVPAEDLNAKVKTMVAAGESVLWLTRR